MPLEGGGGAIDLVIHACRCALPEALDLLSELPRRLTADRRPRPPCPELHWPTLRRYLVKRRGLADVLVDLCRDLGLVHADCHGNAVFVRRNAAGKALGAEIAPAAGQRSGSALGIEAAPSPLARGGFWMSWDPDWPLSVILAKSALDALSVLSLHLVPARRKGCVVVSTGGVTESLPDWIEAWNPRRIFCAYDATRQGDDAAARLIRHEGRGLELYVHAATAPENRWGPMTAPRLNGARSPDPIAHNQADPEPNRRGCAQRMAVLDPNRHGPVHLHPPDKTAHTAENEQISALLDDRQHSPFSVAPGTRKRRVSAH